MIHLQVALFEGDLWTEVVTGGPIRLHLAVPYSPPPCVLTGGGEGLILIVLW